MPSFKFCLLTSSESNFDFLFSSANSNEFGYCLFNKFGLAN